MDFLKRKVQMKKRNIYILYAIALLQGLVFYAPVATLYRQAAGLGIFQITLIESVSLFLTICLEIPWGWLADRIGYRRTMLVCCGLYFVSKVVFWQAETFGGFLLERVILSVVCAGLSGVDSSMLYLSCGEADSHRVFSVYQNLGQLGILLAGGAYALFVGENYRLAAFLTVLSYGAAAVLALGLEEVREIREVPKQLAAAQGKELLAVLRQQLTDRKVVLLLISAALLAQTHQTVTVFLSQLQYVRAGMSNRAISLAYLAISLAGLAGGFSAALCAKVGEKTMGSLLLALSAVSCAAMGACAAPWLSVLAVVLLRGCFNLMQPLCLAIQNKLIATRDRATALSMNAVVQDGLGVCLNLIFGRIAEVDLPAALFFGAGLCAIGLVLYRASGCFGERENR